MFKEDQSGASRRIFEKESAVLQSLRSLHEEHIIELLVTFEQKGRFAMIFPLADLGTLKQFWEETEPPRALGSFTFRSYEVDYIGAMAGIASGLLAFHDAGGRHHDLTPDNILIFRSDRSKVGIWKIADFGRSSFTSGEPNLISESNSGFGTYEPPEYHLKEKPSYKTDMWSLGCIFLECLVWVRFGSQAIEDFADDRLNDKSESVTNFQNDYFFNVEMDKPLQPSKAELRPAVTKWIRDLARCKSYGPALPELLALIEKELLLVNPRRRSNANIINAKMQLIHLKVTNICLDILGDFQDELKNPSFVQGNRMMTPEIPIVTRRHAALFPADAQDASSLPQEAP